MWFDDCQCHHHRTPLAYISTCSVLAPLIVGEHLVDSVGTRRPANKLLWTCIFDEVAFRGPLFMVGLCLEHYTKDAAAVGDASLKNVSLSTDLNITIP